MGKKGYGTRYEESYRAMTTFHHARTPLIVLVSGSYCTGKSTIASKLAQRMNLPNVLQTDLLADLLREDTTSTRGGIYNNEEENENSKDRPSCSDVRSGPLWSIRNKQESSSGAAHSDKDISACQSELIREFQSECAVVLRGLAGSIEKAVTEGKSIIIEGVHLDINPILKYIHDLCTKMDSRNHDDSVDAASVKFSLGNVIVVPLLLKVNYLPTKENVERDKMVERWLETRRDEMTAMSAEVPNREQILVRHISKCYLNISFHYVSTS